MKTTTKSILVAATILTGLASSAGASDILGNLPAGNLTGNPSYIGPVSSQYLFSMYEGFTMNQSCTLDSFSVMLLQDSGTVTFTAGLYADNGGQLGTLLLSLGSVTPSGGTFTEYTFDAGSSFTLDSSSTYWIGLAGSGTTGSYGEWGADSANGNNGIRPTSPGSVATYVHSIFANGYDVGYYFDTRMPAFEIDATLTSVPEPGIMSLMAVSLLGLVGINLCRKPKSAQ